MSCLVHTSRKYIEPFPLSPLVFENIVETGENAGNHNVVKPMKDQLNILEICPLQILSIWTRLKLCYLLEG